MSNCEVCGIELKGKQQKFCSNKCKCKTSNHKHQSYVAQQERAKRRKAKLIMMNGGKCSLCGYNKNYAALAFHHSDPGIKSFELDGRALSNHSWELILSEVAKCILLCQNCHQEVHHPDHTINIADVDLHGLEKTLPLSNFCCDCGKQIKVANTSRCPECFHKKQEKVSWPPTEELLKLLETNSYLAVGRMLGVSDNALRKRIKNHPTNSNT